MKNLILFICLIFATSLFLSGCSSTKTTTKTESVTTQITSPKSMPIKTADSDFARGLSSMLNKNYVLLSENKVYCTRSADFENVYIFGAVVKSGSQVFNAIWTTNDVSFFGGGVVYSVNDYANKSSGMGFAKDNGAEVTEYSDGYSRINQKLLSDMSQEVNKK